MFQHTATRRWLQIRINTCICHSRFQHTATRRWLLRRKYSTAFRFLGFNTQPPEGGCFPSFIRNSKNRQFQHTATRRWLQMIFYIFLFHRQFQHTATRRWLPFNQILQRKTTQFQHTATRRWLHFDFFSSGVILKVSTHSHPKVAASKAVLFSRCSFSFNTQPPEGGCKIGFINLTQAYSFNTQPPEGGCHQYFFCLYIIYSFNTQPPEGGCLPISKFTC